MAGDPAGRSPEPHRAGPRQRHRARAPSQAAAAARGQRAERWLRQAALALRLTSTTKARAGRSQRGCLPVSRLSWCRAMREHKRVWPCRISLQGEKGTEALSWAGKHLLGLIMPSTLPGNVCPLGDSCSWAPSPPSPFQSVQPSLGDKALLPTATGGLCRALQAQGTNAAGGGCGEKGLSPGQQPHCIVPGVGTEQRVPDALALQSHQPLVPALQAQQRLRRLHRKPVCTAKARSRWEHWPWLQRYGKGQDENWDLLALVGRRCSAWHALQKASTSCGICSVVLKIWKSRATNRRAE